MGLIGALSNQRHAADLRDLAIELGSLDGAPPRQQSAREPRRRAGAILAAIVQILSLADRPLGPREIQLAAEGLLGEPLRYGYVKQALSAHARGIEGAPLFDRADGRYWLGTSPDGLTR